MLRIYHKWYAYRIWYGYYRSLLIYSLSVENRDLTLNTLLLYLYFERYHFEINK